VAGPRRPTAEQRQRMVELHRLVDENLDRLDDRLTPDVLRQLRTFSAVGEWSLAADNLAAYLVKRRTPVTAAEKDGLRDLFDLLYSFGEPPSELRYLASRDEVLASLNVTDPGQQ
jgi:hypothetical protein